MSPFRLVLVLVPLVALVAGDKVRLSDVQTLTFRKGELTAHRRVDPVPQLTCLGGPCDTHMPETVQCVNKGTGYDLSDISWECSADISPGYRIVDATVGCEGYEHSSDPYVLAGSCGVEFSIHGSAPPSPPPLRSDQNSDDPAFLALLIIMAIVWIYIAYCIAYGVYRMYMDCCGGDEEPEDPPPPYFPEPNTQRAAPPPPRPSTRASGDGFWSGYFLGSMTSTRRTTNNYYSSGGFYSSSAPTSFASSSTTFHANTRNR